MEEHQHFISLGACGATTMGELHFVDSLTSSNCERREQPYAWDRYVAIVA